MITDKQVIERLREYEVEFTPILQSIRLELSITKPDISVLSRLSNELCDPLLDFMNLLDNISSAKRKLSNKGVKK